MKLTISGSVAALLLAIPAIGADQKDVIGVSPNPAGLKVIEEKCLNCHNRQRIEESARKKERVERVLERMEKKGVVVTAKEREVFGHFWRQDPFKSK